MVKEECKICHKKFGINKGYDLGVGLLNQIVDDEDGNDMLIISSEVSNYLCKKCFKELRKKLKWLEE